MSDTSQPGNAPGLPFEQPTPTPDAPGSDPWAPPAGPPTDHAPPARHPHQARSPDLSPPPVLTGPSTLNGSQHPPTDSSTGRPSAAWAGLSGALALTCLVAGVVFGMLSANAENDDLVVAQAERIEELEDEVGDQPSPIGPRLFTGSIPDDQFAPGEAATVDEWDMTIEEWIPDATEEILDHDTSNDAPDAGTVLTLVTISGTYEGTGSSLPWLDIGVGYVGSDQLRRTDTSCRAATPDAMAEIRLVSNGDSITGTFCIALPADQIGTGSAYLHETTSPAEPIWFQVD